MIFQEIIQLLKKIQITDSMLIYKKKQIFKKMLKNKIIKKMKRLRN